MANLWLVPVRWDGTEAELHSERLLLEPEEHKERLLRAVQAVHPRLLLLFKAALLLDDEAADACGVAELPFALEQGGGIRLAAADALTDRAAGSEPLWPLSHCAEAYLHRLIAPAEAEQLMAAVNAEPDIQPWIQAMRNWFGQGLHVILLREDGSL
ncbi:hypothetical protein ACFQI7_05820 [Paenibacillus allorhizosphaerae]|uniref:Uncharacterized protein n=1 Tax=Paenibacillus allorhizosphaerae TaxID=2849866 RepID=A0ABM8VBJ2_9BACL|nr:hypothetical protein [Paenibacillus allorhizosphaerae]CAG7620365.1 hypothetical protein PAECIP111802_00662 [Paenibacillus allorhizosphaerae]